MRARGVLLDVDGVLVLSWEPLPGAVDAMQRLRDLGPVLRFLTNTTSRSRADIGRLLRRAGIPLDDDELFTAGVATAAFLAREYRHARCLVLNDGPRDDLEAADVQFVDWGRSADVVVVGSAGQSFTWEAMNLAARAIVDGADLVAMHGTASWNTKEGLSVDGGAYVAALERATGCRATVIGKPAPTMFLEALTSMQVEATEAVMVGDDLVNDVLAAQKVGVRGVLVRTGKYRAETLETSLDRPDAVLESVADLPS